MMEQAGAGDGLEARIRSAGHSTWRCEGGEGDRRKQIRHGLIMSAAEQSVVSSSRDLHARVGCCAGAGDCMPREGGTVSGVV